MREMPLPLEMLSLHRSLVRDRALIEYIQLCIHRSMGLPVSEKRNWHSAAPSLLPKEQYQ